MRTLALTLAGALLLSGGSALAQKPTGHVLRQPVSDQRQGGETIADAVEMPFPFTDTGATCDNVDDYDEVCPYPGSTSPDVVYTFVPTLDTVASVDMLGSSYDTKIYLYDADQNLLACNDDYYPDYVSCIQAMPFESGRRYYLVIDGYGGDCGEYVVSFCEHLPCVTECIELDQLEAEPPLEEGYVDTYNGGCDVDPPVFQSLELPPGEDVLRFCGTSGYVGEGGDTRIDTDWLQVTAGGEELVIDFESPYGFAMRLEVAFLDGCEDVSLLPYELGTCSTMNGIVVPTTPGQVVTLRAAPLTPFRSGCHWRDIDHYRLRITGVAGAVAVQLRSWSEVKGLYD